ncbi:hypothetical protein [Planococcus lenghuensis]|uniref:Uncharacterized protein n=1 Tax=Planococcus lenghuensis TaxID=2213202 RepID=A0A1Q2KZB5_9BACL|nr:hypothetical protein [Planococcus lenghuensis]AQQ53147.1 hypothetical protein B0X71_08615 [Planococcus lenghuensis]
MGSEEGLKFRPMKSISVSLFIAGSLLIGGCSGEETGEGEKLAEEAETRPEPVDTQEDGQVESAKEAIQAVITEMFTAPNEQLRELKQQADELYESDPYSTEEEYTAFMESPEQQAIETYLEETYAPYFTADGFQDQRAGGFSPGYALIGLGKENQAIVRPIEIDQSDNSTAENNYYFTFMVDYTNTAGVTKPYKLEGMAIVPEKGKIGKIIFTDDEGLFEQVSDDRNSELQP